MDLYTGTSSVSCASGTNTWTVNGTISMAGVFPGHKLWVGSRTASIPAAPLRMFRIATINKAANPVTFTTTDNADQTYSSTPFFIEVESDDPTGFANLLWTTVLNQLATMFGIGSTQYAGGGSQFALPRDVGASAVAELAFMLRSGATHTRSFFWRQRQVSGAEVLELIATPDGTTELSVLSVNRATGALTIAGDQTPAVTLRGNSDYTILSTDRDIILNATWTAGRTFTLPANSSRALGGRIRIIDGIAAITPGTPITITRAGSDTINGVTSITIPKSRAVIEIVKTGTGQWTVDPAVFGDQVARSRISSLQSLVSAIAPAGAGAAAAGAASLMDKIAALGIETPPGLILDFLTDSYMIRERALAGGIAAFLTALGDGAASRSSSAWFFNASGVLTEASSNVLRLDHDPVTLARLGLLMEGARTNSFPNNTMAGASAGTPGTAPTSWTLSAAPAGMTRTIHGVGTEDGIDYLDIEFSGTNTSGTEQTLQMLPSNATAITASAGQAWSLSLFLRLTAGAWPAGSVQMRMRFAQADGTLVSLPSIDSKAVNGAALRTQRQGLTQTAPASTERITGGFYVIVANNEAVSFRVRIGLPQLEQGASVSSPIKTSSGAVTRALDGLWLPVTPWFNQSEGSALAEWQNGAILSSVARFEIHNNANGDNLLAFRNLGSGNFAPQMFMTVGGNASSASSTVAPTANAVARQAGAWKSADYAASFDGAAVFTSSLSGVPTGLTRMQVGNRRLGNEPPFGHIRRIVAFPARLSNAQLQALSGATL